MIGPVDSKCAENLCHGHREIKLSASADEMRIFYNLAMDRVHYFPGRNAIYFVESAYWAVLDIISTLLKGMGSPIQVEQLYLDKGSYFKGGKRVRLSPDQAVPVLVALRLKGIQVVVSE
ncbi:MAG: hypothetical protein GY703_16070 [Gammaproteobacteria bacterium]|nr:hypothetical protein [Gammaproteobacteria bacterium]